VFEIHNELKRTLAGRDAGAPDSPLAPVLHSFIADIRFPSRVWRVMEKFRPEIIFHAAAHKHVPLMELNPTEAAANNILGTRNVLEAALEFDVERFVMVSTDKAVNPTSVMGASKRAAELLVLRAARQTGKPYVAVRFGNVLGSRGSVVLTFKQQIAQGGPVTVSHPDMKRFFMTIPEAVQLVLQSSLLGRGGEIFVLDMGNPVKIVDLARDLIELSGLEVDRDVDIAYTGIRPGEKLYEELFIEGERYERTRHEKVLIARNAGAFVPGDLDAVVEELKQAVAADDGTRVIRCLERLIPEYQSEHRLAGEERCSEPQPAAA
jgi:FlaA1/EpsC-like NDP-sugar epimerase